MTKGFVLFAPNKEAALTVSKEVGDIKVMNKANAILFVESAINSIDKASGHRYVEFKTLENTHHEAYISFIVFEMENRLMKILTPKLGFIPQNMDVLRVLVTHVCNRDRALLNVGK